MTDNLQEELGSFLKAWGEAIVSNDADAIARFSLSEWKLVTPESGPVDSQAFLDAVRSGDLKHDTFDVEIHHVSRLGETAIAIAHVRNSGTFRGAPFTADEWSTDVLVRRDGGWVCVLSALTPRTRAA